MTQSEIYLAKYDRVWQRKGTSKPLGKLLTLVEGDSLDNYEQVRAKAEPPAKASKSKAPDNA